jgi:hypothetical protein
MSVGLKALPPLLLATAKVLYKTSPVDRLRDGFFRYNMAKGGMTIEDMRFYVRPVLGPSVKNLGGRFQDPNLPADLIYDNHGTHDHLDILSLLTKTGITPIWLPV